MSDNERSSQCRFPNPRPHKWSGSDGGFPRTGEQVSTDTLTRTCNCGERDQTPHASDCSVHNEPAFPKGPCDCG